MIRKESLIPTLAIMALNNYGYPVMSREEGRESQCRPATLMFVSRGSHHLMLSTGMKETEPSITPRGWYDLRRKLETVTTEKKNLTSSQK